MIRQAHPFEKAILYKRWKQYFAHDDGGSIDEYFAHHYSEQASLLYVENDEIICSLSAHIHPMKLWGKDIEVVFISGVITLERYRNQGYMRKLMEALCIQYKAYPLLALQAYEPRLYTPYGFTMMSYHYTTTLPYTKIISTKYHEVPVHEIALLDIYNACMKDYDGYRIRTTLIYQSLCKALQSQGFDLYAVGDEQMQGYMQYKVTTNHVVIEEMLYKDEDAYLALLQKAMSYGLPTKLTLPFPLPLSDATQQGDLMMKVMNSDVLAQLYDKQIPNEEAFLQLLKQPLYTNEYW